MANVLVKVRMTNNIVNRLIKARQSDVAIKAIQQRHSFNSSRSC